MYTNQIFDCLTTKENEGVKVIRLHSRGLRVRRLDVQSQIKNKMGKKKSSCSKSTSSEFSEICLWHP